MGCGFEQLISHATDADVSWQTLHEEGPAHLYGGRWDAKTIYLCSMIVGLTMPYVAMWTLAACRSACSPRDHGCGDLHASRE